MSLAICPKQNRQPNFLAMTIWWCHPYFRIYAYDSRCIYAGRLAKQLINLVAAHANSYLLIL